jgi:hypothetical protein
MGEVSWPPMIWIGGSPGAGKSTAARELARESDLPLHPIDLWTYDHVERMPLVQSLDEELADGPEAAAESFVRISRTRLELVVQDVGARELGVVPTLVEGPQLFPSMASDAVPGVWLVPAAGLTRQAREERLARAEDSAGRARLEALLERDAVLARMVREEAADFGRPLIEIPADPDWETVAIAVKAALATAFNESPRLQPGEELSRQRQYENQVACRQGRLWQAEIGLAELPPFPFACECGYSGCRLTWAGTPDQYDERRGTGWLLAEEHD